MEMQELIHNGEGRYITREGYVKEGSIWLYPLNVEYPQIDWFTVAHNDTI